jgi:tryptophan-rich sensory protein
MSDTFRFKTWHAAAFLGGISAISALAASKDAHAYWRGLNRPAKAPPAWAFMAIWSGLNVMQVWADLRILNNPDLPERQTLIGLRAINWLLYAVATPAFFRTRRQAGGEAVTLAEGVTAGATLALLAKGDPVAAAAITPLALWTAYAGLMGTDLASDNPDHLVDRLRWQGAF